MDPRETPQASLMSSTEVIEDQDLMGTTTSKHKSKAHTVPGEDRSKLEGFISRRGSELALKHLCEKFGAELFDKLPKLWECMTEILKPDSSNGQPAANDENIAQVIDRIKDPQPLINNIQVYIYSTSLCMYRLLTLQISCTYIDDGKLSHAPQYIYK